MESNTYDTVKVEVWSDIVCPFCYLGKRKLEKAIKKLNAENKVEVVYRSFQLDPSFPMDSTITTMEYLTRKGYHPEQVAVMSDQLTTKGKAYGITYDFDKAHSFNTKNAHRLIHWAYEIQKGIALKDSLMEAYFSLGINLSDSAKLCAVVEKVGLDAEQAKAVLSSEKYIKEVEADIARAKELGIRGVPHFLINGEKAFSGAQQDEVFEQIIQSALKNLPKTPVDTAGAVCVPGEKCD